VVKDLSAHRDQLRQRLTAELESSQAKFPGSLSANCACAEACWNSST
jgi:hypothetical protein